MPMMRALLRGTSGVSQSIDSAPVPPGSPILFNDLARGVEAMRGELDAAVARVLSSGWFVLGTEGQARA
jgi:hypothetical protein